MHDVQILPANRSLVSTPTADVLYAAYHRREPLTVASGQNTLTSSCFWPSKAIDRTAKKQTFRRQALFQDRVD